MDISIQGSRLPGHELTDIHFPSTSLGAASVLPLRKLWRVNAAMGFHKHAMDGASRGTRWEFHTIPSLPHNRPCHLIFAPFLRSGRCYITLGGATIPPKYIRWHHYLSQSAEVFFLCLFCFVVVLRPSNI